MALQLVRKPIAHSIHTIHLKNSPFALNVNMERLNIVQFRDLATVRFGQTFWSIVSGPRIPGLDRATAIQRQETCLDSGEFPVDVEVFDLSFGKCQKKCIGWLSKFDNFRKTKF